MVEKTPEKSEIDMADINMNAFPQATDAAYMYAEAADGSQVKIKKDDLATALAEYLPINSAVANVNVERLYVWYIETKKNGTAIGKVIILSTDGTLESRNFSSISTDYKISVIFEKGIPKGTKVFVFYRIV